MAACPGKAIRRRNIAADVARFWQQTHGHVLVAGPGTFASIPAAAFADRTIVEIRSHTAPAAVLARFPGRVVFIGGGPPVWAAFADLIESGTSRGCPTTARPTAGSIRHGWQARLARDRRRRRLAVATGGRGLGLRLEHVGADRGQEPDRQDEEGAALEKMPTMNAATMAPAKIMAGNPPLMNSLFRSCISLTASVSLLP